MANDEEKKTIRCTRCAEPAVVTNTSSVGVRMKESGFQFVMLSDGGHVWVCNTCTKIVVEGYSKLKEVFGNRTRNVSLYTISFIAGDKGRERE